MSRHGYVEIDGSESEETEAAIHEYESELQRQM